jgi:hypothetical protein
MGGKPKLSSSSSETGSKLTVGSYNLFRRATVLSSHRSICTLATRLKIVTVIMSGIDLFTETSSLYVRRSSVAQ